MSRRRLFIDVRPLRQSPEYRRLWLGGALSGFGSQMTTYAVALQVFRITHSSAAVGGIGLATALPAIGFGLFGGPIIDAVDRRLLVVSLRGLASVLSALLAVQAFLGQRHVSVLYVLVGLEFLVSSVSAPATRTFAPRLLGTELIPSAAALTGMAFQLSLIAGPPVAGIVTAAVGLKVCYVIDAVSFLAALYAAYRLPPMPPEGGPSRLGIAALRESLGFIRHSPPLVGALVSDLSAMSLAMPVALFPAINAARFHGSPRTLGLLSAGLAVGGVVASLFSGPVTHVRRRGRAGLICVSFWGAGLIGFGLVHQLLPTLGCLAVAGAADVLSVVFRTSIIQTETPDRLRGRVSTAEFLVGAAAPQVGNFRGGVIATLTSPGTSGWIGGASAIAGAAVIAATLPGFRNYVSQM